MQGGHQEVARSSRSITREHTASAIRTVRRGGKANNQEPRVRIPETGNWTSPVRLIAVCASLVFGDAPTVFTQAWTPITTDNVVVNDLQRLHNAERAWVQ